MEIGCDIMELVHKETTEYENKNWDKTYKYHIDNFDDFIEIIKSLEADYGVVEDILCIKKDKDNKVIDYIEYDTMDELMKKHKNKYNNYDIYKFISKEKYISFIIDMNNNTLIVSSSEGTLGKREKDSNMVEYYQDEYG